MILPNYKRLNKKDYNEEEQELIDKLSFIINDGFSPLYSATAGRLSLEDNTLSAVRDVTLQVGANGIPVSRSVFSLSNSKVTVVRQCFVGRAVNLTNPKSYPTSGVTISFTQDVNNVIIDHVTGLTPGDQWTLTVTAFGVN